ncbi:hypothetical protein Tco_1188937 [Tanacetum coccineum]
MSTDTEFLESSKMDVSSEENSSEGNVGSNIKVSNFEILFPNQIEEAGPDLRRPVMTHLPENIVLAHKESDDNKYLVNFTNYQKLVGKLIYLTLA